MGNADLSKFQRCVVDVIVSDLQVLRIALQARRERLKQEPAFAHPNLRGLGYHISDSLYRSFLLGGGGSNADIFDNWGSDAAASAPRLSAK